MGIEWLGRTICLFIPNPSCMHQKCVSISNQSRHATASLIVEWQSAIGNRYIHPIGWCRIYCNLHGFAFISVTSSTYPKSDRFLFAQISTRPFWFQSRTWPFQQGGLLVAQNLIVFERSVGRVLMKWSPSFAGWLFIGTGRWAGINESKKKWSKQMGIHSVTHGCLANECFLEPNALVETPMPSLD